MILFFLFFVQLVFCSSSSSNLAGSAQNLTSKESREFTGEEELNKTKLLESRIQLTAEISKEAEKQGMVLYRKRFEIQNWPEFIPRNRSYWDVEALETIREALPTFIFKKTEKVTTNPDSCRRRNENTLDRVKLVKLLRERYFEQVTDTGRKKAMNWSKYHIKGWPINVHFDSSRWSCVDVMNIYRQLKKIQFIPIKPGENRSITYSDGHVEESVAKEKVSRNSLKRKSVFKIEKKSTRVCKRSSKSESQSENELEYGSGFQDVKHEVKIEGEDSNETLIAITCVKDTELKGDIDDWTLEDDDSILISDFETKDSFDLQDSNHGSCSSFIAKSSGTISVVPASDDQFFFKILNDFEYDDEADSSVQEILMTYNPEIDSFLLESESSDI